MFSKIYGAALDGIDARLVQVEADVSDGLPVFDMVGMLASEVREARERVRGLHDKKTVGIFIGPEGGFEEDEIALATKAGIHPITLGKRILRTETAGLCILSVIMFELEQ